MKAYLQAFVNFEQNNWARVLPMAEFAYINAKNASTGHTPFELNFGYHPQTDGQTKWQNSIMEAYLWAFVNFE